VIVVKKNIKQNSLETHKGVVRILFHPSGHRVLVTTSMEPPRDTMTIMIDVIRREIFVQKLLRSYRPENAILHLFSHPVPRLNAIFLSSGERYVVELSTLIGVDCGRGFVAVGGVMGSITVLLMAFVHGVRSSVVADTFPRLRVAATTPYIMTSMRINRCLILFTRD
jgi:hypothetical protein